MRIRKVGHSFIRSGSSFIEDPTKSSRTRTRKRTASVVWAVALLIVLVIVMQHVVSDRSSSTSHQAKKKMGSVTNNNAAPDDARKKRNERLAAASDVPRWIRHYVRWHQKMRAKFPGRRLFEDPAAPKLLIRTCLGLCGGLNDRLGQLPWDLYLANQTGRLLLVHWHRPVPLEHFLLPAQLDWTVPPDVPGFFPSFEGDKDVRVSREGMKAVRAYKELFEGYNSENPEADFWNEHFDAAVQRATTGAFKDIKVLRHRLLGHINEDALEQRLKDLGETDMIHWTGTFGKIFHIFFKPSPAVQSQLNDVYHQLHVQPGEYSAVHCRVRHPKAWPQNVNVVGKNKDYPADKTGLPWHGEMRAFAIETAVRAVRCASQLLKSPKEPIYFFSDSNDLVRFMTQEAADPTHHWTDKADLTAVEVVKKTSVVSRKSALDEENAHIDRQKGRDPPAYYATFVDLLLAVNARCITYGVGYYAVLAGKISGTSCKLLYQSEYWGDANNRKRMNVEHCVLNE